MQHGERRSEMSHLWGIFIVASLNSSTLHNFYFILMSAEKKIKKAFTSLTIPNPISIEKPREFYFYF